MHLSTVLPRRRETLRAFGLFLAATALSTTAVLAGGQFKSGGGTWGSDLTVFGLATGLGKNLLLTVNADATGLAPAVCRNNGGNVAPGQVGLPVGGSGQGFLTSTQNGRASGITNEILPTFGGSPPGPDQAGCPNPNWTVDPQPDATRVDWRSVHVEGVLANGSFITMELVCTTSFRNDGTTFGTCVRQ